jgi:hypothetical protein
MISLTAIASKIWPRVNSPDGFDIKDLKYFDYEVELWKTQLPDSLKYIPVQGAISHALDSTDMRLRIVSHLRANQVRLLIGRPILLKTEAILSNLEYAASVVGVAKETIQILSAINQATNVYRSQQSLYNYFLASALAALFLAVAHAPGEFSSTSRDEFYMALELVRGLSANSFVAKRLWATIKVLKEIGPKIGLTAVRATLDQADDPHSNAAASMVGLAGHDMGQTQPPPTATGIAGVGEVWEGVADDLTNLFEAAGGIPTAQTQENSDLLWLMPQDSLLRVFRDFY